MNATENNLVNIFAGAMGITKENNKEILEQLNRIDELTNEESETRTRFESLLSNVKRDGIDHLLIYMGNHGFFYCPASLDNDYAYKGGLLQHSLDVYDAAMKVRNEMLSEEPSLSTFLDEDSVTIVSLLHDFCTMDEYDLDANDKPCQAGCPFPLGGHGDKSVILIQQYIRLQLPEAIAIRWHMGEMACETSNDKEIFKKALKYPLCKLLVEAVARICVKEQM